MALASTRTDAGRGDARARAASQIISDRMVLIRNVGWDRARGWQYLEMLLCAGMCRMRSAKSIWSWEPRPRAESRDA